MDKKEIIALSNKIKTLIAERRLKEAFSELSQIISKVGNWSISERLLRLEETYRYMIHYMFEGIDDPQRDALYQSLIGDLFDITDEIERELLCNSGVARLYFSTLRSNSKKRDTLNNLINHYNAVNAKYELSEEVGMLNIDILKDKESALSEIFIAIWLILHIDNKDMNLIREIVNNDDSSKELKSQIISALFIGLLEYYDKNKITLLIEFYHSVSDREIALRALVYLVFILFKHGDKINKSLDLCHRLESLADYEKFNSDIKNIIINLIRTRDTDRINKKMKDEVIPELMKLQPEISKRFKGSENEIDIANIEENPEWSELLDKSGLSSKLKDLTEMHMDGGDIFMIAFSNLKNFSFFNSIGNWFLPFSINHSEIYEVAEKINENIVSMICDDSAMCDSDKYSFALSIAKMPDVQRQMMLSQFDGQLQQLKEHRQSLPTATDSDNLISKHIRDLYRFFKLFNRRSEFEDPFKNNLNFIYLPVIGRLAASEENLRLIGEFYFSHGYYTDAVDIFNILLQTGVAEALIYQKIGFCYQSEKNFVKALEYYRKAELVEPDNIWLVKKIALCHKSLKQYSDAIEYYRKSIEKDENNLSLVMNLGHCLLQSNQYEEALKCYYKVEYLDDKSNRAIRPIAWCEFELHHYDISEKYYEKILCDEPSAQDYINAGHLAIVTNDIQKAAGLYIKSIEALNKDIDKFMSMFNDDRIYLSAHGVDLNKLPIMIDKLLYDLK